MLNSWTTWMSDCSCHRFNVMPGVSDSKYLLGIWDPLFRCCSTFKSSELLKVLYCICNCIHHTQFQELGRCTWRQHLDKQIMLSWSEKVCLFHLILIFGLFLDVDLIQNLRGNLATLMQSWFIDLLWCSMSASAKDTNSTLRRSSALSRWCLEALQINALIVLRLSQLWLIGKKYSRTRVRAIKLKM